MSSRTTSRGALLAGALLVVAGAMAFRNQGAILSGLYERRLLAESTAADDTVGAARALAARDRARAEALPPRARLRFLVATGFSAADVGRGLKSTGDAAQDAAALVAEERRLQTLVAELTRAEPEAIASLAGASDPVVRRNFFQALTIGADARSLEIARAHLRDPVPEVRVAAFLAGYAMTARGGDPARGEDFFKEAARSEGLGARTLDTVGAHADPAAIPIIIAYLESPFVSDMEKQLAAESIRRLAGEKRAASAPEGTGAEAWKAWWEKVK